MLDKIAERRANLVQRQQDIATMLGELDELEGRCASLLDAKAVETSKPVRARG